MNEIIFPVQSSILSPDALLREVNLRYGFKALKCRLWSIGLNDVYQIEESTRKYFLRTSHTIRFSRKDYEEELNVILQLRTRNVNTCIPVKQQDDTYIWEINALEGKRYAILFEEVKNDKTSSTYHIGNLAAVLHKTADDINFSISRSPLSFHQLIEDPIKIMKESNQMKIDSLKYLEEASTQMWNDITINIPKITPYYGYCHGDMHSGNVYCVNNIPQVFDFDCMGYGYRAYDLCVYLWDETSVNEAFIDSDEWKNYLKGYNEVRELTNAEICSLPAFAALRQLWFIGLIINATKLNNSWDGINDYFIDEQLKRFKFWFEKWKSNKGRLQV